MDDYYMGTILAWAGSFAPRNFQFCQGQLLQVSQYSALYSLLSTTYGGDGRMSFGLPDLRGRSPMGAGRGPGLTMRQRGNYLGREVEQLAVPQLALHTHVLTGQVTIEFPGIPATNTPGTYSSPGQNKNRVVAAVPDMGEEEIKAYSEDEPNTNLRPIGSQLTDITGGEIGSTGGNQGHNNIHPACVVNYIICIQGLFPSRP